MVVFLGAALAAAALAAAAAPAFAQAARGARTAFGNTFAMRCAQAVAAGDVSDEALAICDNSINIENMTPLEKAGVHMNRGALHLRRREGQAALADFDATIAIERRNAEAHVNRGAALVMTGQPGPAVAAITTALTLGVRQPYKAYFNRGAAREALGDVRGAYEDYNTALEIQPDWGPAEEELRRFARARREHLAQAAGEQAPAPQ